MRRVVLQQHIYVRQQLLLADFVLAQLKGVLVDDLGGRELVPGLGVDPHQQVHVIAVGAARKQHAFEFHRHVPQGAQFGGQQQELALGETAPGRAFHLHPDVAPQIQRLALAVHDRIQPRQAHPVVVAQLATGVANGLEHAQRLLRPAQALVGVGQVTQLQGIGRQKRLQALKRRQRRLVPAPIQPGLEQEQQRTHVRPMLVEVALDHRHAFREKAHRKHQSRAFDQNPGAGGVALLQGLPHGQRGIVVGDVEIVRRQTVIPLGLVRFRLHHPAILVDHRTGIARRFVQGHQPAALGNVGFRTFQSPIQLYGPVILLGLDQRLHPKAQEVLVGGVP